MDDGDSGKLQPHFCTKYKMYLQQYYCPHDGPHFEGFDGGERMARVGVEADAVGRPNSEQLHSGVQTAGS